MASDHQAFEGREQRILVSDDEHGADLQNLGHHERVSASADADTFEKALLKDEHFLNNIDRALRRDEQQQPPDLSMLFNWRPRSADGCSRCPGHLKSESHDMRGHLRVRPRSAVELRSKSKSSMKSCTPRSAFDEKDTQPRTLSRPMSSSGIRCVDARSRLGYHRGLPRSSAVESRFPRYVSDIGSVIDNMKALEQSERAKIAADEAKAQKSSKSKNIQITRHKDLCVLKFDIDGTRLMVKRWSKGFAMHPPKRAPLKPPLDSRGCRGPPFAEAKCANHLAEDLSSLGTYEAVGQL